jgi:hypothetical protein
MDQNILYVTASVFVVLALLANTYFVYRYARYSAWNSNPVGRTHMVRSVAMGAILVYAFTGRWLPVSDLVQDMLGLAVWVTVFFIELRLTYTLVAVQGGRITLDQVKKTTKEQ